MKLVAFGCSLTYGSALPDTWDHKTESVIWNENPSKYAWPNKLAELYSVECVNLSKTGASNKQICQTVIDNFKSINEDDLVFIQWSYTNRWCIIDEHRVHKIHHWQTNDSHVTNIFGLTNKKAISDRPQRIEINRANAFYKYLYNYNDMMLELNRNMHYIGLLLDSKNIKNYHLHPNRTGPKRQGMKAYETNIYSWNTCNLLNTNFEDSREQYPELAHDDQHPGVDAHACHASNIFEEINRN